MPITPERLDEARLRADIADTAAGVETAPARLEELPALMSLIEDTWGAPAVPGRTTLIAAMHAGTTVLVARDDDGAVVGGAFGFLGWSGGVHLHSHQAAVRPGLRGGGIGAALKLRQRERCLANGVTEVHWTFDPLIRRNARFNLVRLGAEVTAFLPDFYGVLDDRISAGDASDRFEVRWRLDSPRVLRALNRVPPPEWRPAAAPMRLPGDFERLRAGDPEAAHALRAASRDYFARLAEPGMRIELDRRGDWVLTRDTADREPGDEAGGAVPEPVAGPHD